jgi:hypothetical protein
MKATVQYQHKGHHVVVNRAFIVGVLPKLGYLMKLRPIFQCSFDVTLTFGNI